MYTDIWSVVRIWCIQTHLKLYGKLDVLTLTICLIILIAARQSSWLSQNFSVRLSSRSPMYVYEMVSKSHQGDGHSEMELTNLPLVPHICNQVSIGQIMACRLFSAKPLSKPMLGYCWLDSGIKLQWNFNQNTKLFIHENASEKIVCKMGAILSRGRVKGFKGTLYSTTSKYPHDYHFVVWLLFGNGWYCPYPSGLLHWHRGNLMIVPAPVK